MPPRQGQSQLISPVSSLKAPPDDSPSSSSPSGRGPGAASAATGASARLEDVVSANEEAGELASYGDLGLVGVTDEAIE